MFGYNDENMEYNKALIGLNKGVAFVADFSSLIVGIFAPPSGWIIAAFSGLKILYTSGASHEETGATKSCHDLNVLFSDLKTALAVITAGLVVGLLAATIVSIPLFMLSATALPVIAVLIAGGVVGAL